MRAFRFFLSEPRKAFAVGLAVVAAVAAAFGHPVPQQWGWAVLPLGLVVLAVFTRQRCAEGSDASDVAAVLVLIAFAYLATPAVNAANSFLPDWWPTRGALKADVVRWAIGAALLSLALRFRVPVSRLVALLAIGALAVAFVRFMRTTGGDALYRDDHPSFLFRIWALSQLAPRGAFYNPFWNAGVVDTSPLGSGTTLLVWPFLPVWRARLPHEVYTPIVAVVLIVLIPTLAAVAVRIWGGRAWAMVAAALLAFSPGRALHLWALRFGTVPFAVSGASCMLVCATLTRILSDPKPKWAWALVLGIALVGFLAWPPATVMCVPIVAGVLTAMSWKSFRQWIVLAAGAAMALAVLVPIALVISSQGRVGELSRLGQDSIHWGREILKGAENIRDSIQQINPIIVFLGICGIPLLPDRVTRRLFGVAALGLTLLTGWGEVYKPQFQLTRAVVPLTLMASLPAALWFERLFRNCGRRWREARAGLLMLLAIGAYATIKVYANRTYAPFRTMGQEPREIAAWVAQHVPPGSRVMFAGRTVHAYGGGHVAYLPVLSGRSMMACDYYHFSPAMVEYEYPPPAFREDPESFQEFLDLYNVSAIFTYHERWKRFFRERPDLLEEAARFGTNEERVVFRVLRPPPGLFLKNSGAVTESVKGLRVQLDNPHEPAVLRYHWTRGLFAEPPASVYPYEASRGVKLIGLQPNGCAEVIIRWRPMRR